MFEILASYLILILYLVLFCFISIGIGRIVSKKLSIHFLTTKEDLFHSAGIGFGIIAYSFFFIASLGVLYPNVLIVIMASLGLVSITGWRGIEFNNKFHFSLSSLEFKEILLLLILCALLIIILLLTFAPETGKDALIYHLAVPKLYLQHHGFYFISGNIFSNYPLLTEMLYIPALSLSGEALARGIHFLSLIFIILGMSSVCDKLKLSNYLSYVSIIIFISIPSVFITSSMAYCDNFATLFVLGAILSFINWSKEEQRGWLIISAIYSGLACATKYTTLLFPFLGILGVLWTYRKKHSSTNDALKGMFIYLLITALCAIPFYIKNLVLTGNPFYPFLYNLFGGRGWDATQARYYDFFLSTLGAGRELIDYFLIFWNLSFNAEFNSPRFDGILGPVFLLIIPFFVGVRKINRTIKLILIFCLINIIFWTLTAQQIRYLMTVFPLLAICISYILFQYKEKKLIYGIIIFLIIGSIGYNCFHVTKELVNAKPFAVVFGWESRNEYMNRRIPSYFIFDYVNKNLPQNSYIFMIYMKNYGYLCDRNYYSDSMFESYTLQQILSHSHSPEEARNNLKKAGFSHILCDLRYIYGDWSTLSQIEKTKFHEVEKKYLKVIYQHANYQLYIIAGN